MWQGNISQSLDVLMPKVLFLGSLRVYCDSFASSVTSSHFYHMRGCKRLRCAFLHVLLQMTAIWRLVRASRCYFAVRARYLRPGPPLRRKRSFRVVKIKNFDLQRRASVFLFHKLLFSMASYKALSPKTRSVEEGFSTAFKWHRAFNKRPFSRTLA